MAIFTDTEKPVSMVEIEELQSLTGLVFPAEYIEHLLNQNGGRCQPNVFEFLMKGKIEMGDIDWFLAVYDGEHDNLRTYIDIYKLEEERLPPHILPIAHDSGGNLICISCAKEDYGYIYFWDHEEEFEDEAPLDGGYINLYLIEKSLKRFFASLKVLM
jgi:hypothetical protein